MGAEGENNLDNDGAADFLGSMAEEWTNRVLELLVDPAAHEFDSEEISELFARIEVLFALHQRHLLPIAPEPERLRALIDPFIARWEAYHRENGHEPPAKRKETMIATFQELYRVSINVFGEQRTFVSVTPDPSTMSDEDRNNHEKMMRVFGAVEKLGNPDRPRD